eukprot:2483036-Rhodomonas_salina.1
MISRPPRDLGRGCYPGSTATTTSTRTTTSTSSVTVTVPGDPGSLRVRLSQRAAERTEARKIAPRLPVRGKFPGNLKDLYVILAVFKIHEFGTGLDFVKRVRFDNSRSNTIARSTSTTI